MPDMTSNDFNNLDTLIRAGRTAEAAASINRLSENSKISRSERLQLARLARRAFTPNTGIRLLRPFVRPSEAKAQSSTPEEIIEYAACLSWLGALPECFALLKEIDDKKFPEAAFAMALAHFSQWNYRAAIPLLERYCQNSKVEPYWKLVGEVNLLAALAHEKIPCAELADGLIEKTKSGNYLLLLANVLQFKAEDALNRRELDLGRASLQEAMSYSEKAGRTDTLFMQKWQAIFDLYQNPKNNNFSQVRARASELKHWETIRDCDYHQTVVTKAKELGVHLYFGTPYEAYRTRLLSDCPWLEKALPQTYDWQLSDKTSSVLPLEQDLREGMVLLRLLSALASDFYRPQNLGDLHSKVFPWKHYHPVRSADSLHQALKRLREHFAEMKLPISIIENQSEYHLSSEKIALQIRREADPVERIYTAHLAELQNAFAHKDFTAPLVEKQLGLSRSMVLNYLRHWQQLGLITKNGAGPKTSYRFQN